MKFIYDDMMKRVKSERMNKIRRTELFETLEKYAIQHEYYEDLKTIQEMKDAVLTNKKNKKR